VALCDAEDGKGIDCSDRTREKYKGGTNRTFRGIKFDSFAECSLG
jgi:hypothetical protein